MVLYLRLLLKKLEIEDEIAKKDNKTKMSKKEKSDMIEKLTCEMNLAAKNLDFERAMELRDIIFELESE